MRALVCRQYGHFDELVIEDRDDPVPGDDEILFEVRAAALNFADLLAIAGKYQVRTPPPFIPGNEAAGVVTAVGRNVTRFAVGDPVIGALRGGAFAERAIIREPYALALPERLDFAEGAAYSVAYGTGYHALKQGARLQPGERVLVLGAAGGVGYAAVELARKIFGDLEGRKVLLIGAGEMAELAVEHLIRNRADAVLVANRTFERGVELARRFNGRAIRFDEITDGLETVDIVISSTGASDYVIRRDQARGVMRRRRNRPLFFIDIAVPRDIDPEINRLNNIYVYDIDDLKGVIEENIEDRQRAATKGERLVDEAVIRFRQWYESLDVVPTIVGLRRKFEQVIRAEVARTCPGGSAQGVAEDALDKMVNALVNKILHDPTTILKCEEGHGNKAQLLAATRKLFKLDDNDTC